MTIAQYLTLAAIFAALAFGTTIDAWLNTQTRWHAVCFFGSAICCIASLLAAAWLIGVLPFVCTALALAIAVVRAMKGTL